MDDYGYVVVHIPHASVNIPEEYRKDYLISDSLLHKELLRMTDAFCDELYDPPGFTGRVVADISRLVCDPERFREDRDEINARYGHGLMYTRTSFGRKLRNNDKGLREKIVSQIYDPHHLRLTEAVGKALEEYGFCLIIDGHSFHSRKIVRFDNIFSMPDFDIGTDSWHTPEYLADAVYQEVIKQGYRPRFNSPYGGSITPLTFYRQNKNVVSIMIETNRRLYMDEKTMRRSENFMEIRKVCHELMYTAAETVRERFGRKDG